MKKLYINSIAIALVILSVFVVIDFIGSATVYAVAGPNTATNILVTPSTYQYTTFKGVPVYRLHITNAGDSDTLLSLAMDPFTGDTANDTLVTLHFYNDANDNGIVDQGDVNLGGSAAFASDNTKQIFTFASPLTIPNGVTSILVTADGAGVGNTGIFHLGIDLGTDILMGTAAISNTGAFPFNNAKDLTVSGYRAVVSNY